VVALADRAVFACPPFQRNRCPRVISFICNLAEILSSMIEDLLDSALKAITGKPLEEW
jgi:hypothetical protein